MPGYIFIENIIWLFVNVPQSQSTHQYTTRSSVSLSSTNVSFSRYIQVNFPERLVLKGSPNVGPPCYKRISENQNVDLSNRFIFFFRSPDLVVD